MPKEPYFRTGRERLQTAALQVALQYQVNMRLILISVPFILVFRAAGAAPMVAMLAGVAVGLLGGVRWLISKDAHLCERTRRGVVLASSGMLLVACGVQVLSWWLDLHPFASGRLLILCTIALALVFLLIDGARATLQWALQRVQK